MDLARAPRRAARKKGSGYENDLRFAFASSPDHLPFTSLAPGPWEIKTLDSWIKLHEVMSNDITINDRAQNCESCY